ncbi:MAG: VOC family protein [Acidobacteriaceae bacterium]|nr:VOC family protein [Acidobacteriaceae bacterium]
MADAYERELPPISPHLMVSNASAAIDFYKSAFGAEELSRTMGPDGKRIMHASLLLNGGIIMLNDEFPEFTGGKSFTPEALGGTPVVLHLKVDDADAAFNRAVNAGAKVRFPLQDQFWGDRYGQVTDPFGHVWSIGARIRKVTEEEVQQAAKAQFH